MKVYQVSKKTFFVSNGIDYAAAVDMENDVNIYRSFEKAEKAFNEFVEYASNAFKAEPKVVNRIGLAYWSTEIKGYDRRMVVEFIMKEIQ